MKWLNITAIYLISFGFAYGGTKRAAQQELNNDDLASPGQIRSNISKPIVPKASTAVVGGCDDSSRESEDITSLPYESETPNRLGVAGVRDKRSLEKTQIMVRKVNAALRAESKELIESGVRAIARDAAVLDPTKMTLTQCKAYVNGGARESQEQERNKLYEEFVENYNKARTALQRAAAEIMLILVIRS